MVKLRTEVFLPEIPYKLSYRQKSMMMGSCFTENIGNKLRDWCFPIDINPFGVLYNPVSIANSLEILMSQRMFTMDDVFFANGLWNSFYHHSRFSNAEQQECVNNINSGIKRSARVLKGSNLLFLTFGTSWVFEDKQSGQIVSNCHKLPSSTFRHYRLTSGQIVKKWINIIESLFSFNPELKIVFTVSPIRHLKNGEHENQLSKAILLVAIDELSIFFGKERLFYFPSYEIVMDELRDYRYYSSDMVHLTDVATEIIREKFIEVFIAPEEILIASEIDKINQALNHRPSHPEEKSYQLFIDVQTQKIYELKSKYPYIDVQLILDQFQVKKAAFNF